MFNNKEFNAKLSVKLTNLTKVGSNAAILKQLINGVQNTATVGLKNDSRVTAAINTKYASGNPDAFLKLAQGDALAMLSKGYKALAEGKKMSKNLVETISSTKLELVKASVLYILATEGKGLSNLEKEETDKVIATLVANLKALSDAKAEEAKAKAEAEAEANSKTEGEAEGEANGNSNGNSEGEANGNTNDNGLDIAAILAAVDSMDTIDLAALQAAIAKREAALQAAIAKPLKTRKARSEAA